RGARGEIPAIGVDHVHAIAVALDAPVHDVIFQVRHAGDRDEAGRAVVDGGQPPGIGPAAATAGDADLRTVNLGPGFQVIDGPHGIPRLDPGRRATAADPPPHFLAVG